MEGFYRKEDGQRSYQQKERKDCLPAKQTNERLVSGKVTFPGQKIPDQLELHFWEKLKLVFSDTILGPWVFFLAPGYWGIMRRPPTEPEPLAQADQENQQKFKDKQGHQEWARTTICS